MHAGNIFSALISWLLVKAQGGTMVLRIEDLDRDRSKQAFADGIQADFERLGITWDEGPYYQSDRIEEYQAAFQALGPDLYPCFCSRADLHALSAPHGGERLVYRGACRGLSTNERATLLKERHREGRDAAWRIAVPDEDVAFIDLIQGPFAQNLAQGVGDFILRRSDGAFAYQLAVVVDDASMGIDTVVRGADLLESTPQQIFLARRLGQEAPTYGHVPLMVAKDGRRLAKRDEDAMIDTLLEAHGTPEALIGHLAYLAGLLEADEPISVERLLRLHDTDSIIAALRGRDSIVFS